DGIIESAAKHLNVLHIKSDKKGLSLNRNIGLRKASGKYVAFPDDDCIYYPNTLTKVLEKFNEDHVDIVFGSIRDKETDQSIIRDWPNKKIRLTRSNFFSLYSSITIF